MTFLRTEIPQTQDLSVFFLFFLYEIAFPLEAMWAYGSTNSQMSS